VIARNPDFVALGLAYGAAAVRVTDAHALTETIRAAFARSGPTLIEAVAPQFA
jgi:thiamine pyrophosphate-dependent acetolactate synthase large subunit-like protein